MLANDGPIRISRAMYEALRERLEPIGYEIRTPWRPGLRRISVVLGPRPPQGAPR